MTKGNKGNRTANVHDLDLVPDEDHGFDDDCCCDAASAQFDEGANTDELIDSTKLLAFATKQSSKQTATT